MHFDVKRLSETTGSKNNQCEVEQTKALVSYFKFYFIYQITYMLSVDGAYHIMNNFCLIECQFSLN